MKYIYAIDVDNMHSYSDNDHFILREVYAKKSEAVEMLEGKGFKPVHDNWKGETVYRWSFPKDENGEEISEWEYYDEVPFISSWYGVEATIIKCEVVE